MGGLFLVLSSMQKAAFQNFDFQGGVPIWSSVKYPLDIGYNFVRVFQSHQKSQIHEILALGLIWANVKHFEGRFSKFLFLKGGSPYGPVLKKMGFSRFFSRKSQPFQHIG